MINDWLPLQPLPQSSALHAIGREFDPLTAHRPKHFTPYFSGFFGVEESAMMPTDRLFRKDAAANQEWDLGSLYARRDRRWYLKVRNKCAS